MNRVITPTVHTVNATKNFSTWLTEKMAETKTSDATLAQYVGLERKSILKYRNGQSSPKLNVMAAIFAYFGESTIHISLLDHNEEDTSPCIDPGAEAFESWKKDMRKFLGEAGIKV